jgi:very-short-patch-repair endonuclease
MATKTKTPHPESALEARLALHLRACGMPEFEREHVFAPPRRYRFDFAWPELKVAAEVEGGTWTGGRHTRGDGFERDAEKYNLAALDGWRVLRFTAAMVRDGRALETIRKAIGGKA